MDTREIIAVLCTEGGGVEHTPTPRDSPKQPLTSLPVQCSASSWRCAPFSSGLAARSSLVTTERVHRLHFLHTF